MRSTRSDFSGLTLAHFANDICLNGLIRRKLGQRADAGNGGNVNAGAVACVRVCNGTSSFAAAESRAIGCIDFGSSFGVGLLANASAVGGTTTVEEDFAVVALSGRSVLMTGLFSTGSAGHEGNWRAAVITMFESASFGLDNDAPRIAALDFSTADVVSLEVFESDPSSVTVASRTPRNRWTSDINLAIA